MTLRVLPTAVGAHLAMGSGFIVSSFGDRTEIASSPFVTGGSGAPEHRRHEVTPSFR